MKKNILTIGVLTGACLCSLVTGCGKQNKAGEMNYTVTCKLDSKIHHDSATLLVFEQDYNQLRKCGADRISDDGTVTFTGQTEGAKVAIIRWDNDSTKPFHFVLEQGNINITIKPGSWDITGSQMNGEYLHYINQRNDIMNARVATWQEYLKAASNSTLKRADEQRMVRQDSLLNDSLQNMTVQCINRGDPIGRIVRERYGQQLDQEHMRMLK